MKSKFLSSFRHFWYLALLALLITVPIVAFALWQPKTFNSLLSFTLMNITVLTALRWLLISAVWLYWFDIIALLRRHYQWPAEVYGYWQSVRWRFVLWLAVFEVLVCENGLSYLIHWF